MDNILHFLTEYKEAIVMIISALGLYYKIDKGQAVSKAKSEDFRVLVLEKIEHLVGDFKKLEINFDKLKDYVNIFAANGLDTLHKRLDKVHEEHIDCEKEKSSKIVRLEERCKELHNERYLDNRGQ